MKMTTEEWRDYKARQRADRKAHKQGNLLWAFNQGTALQGGDGYEPLPTTGNKGNRVSFASKLEPRMRKDRRKMLLAKRRAG